MAISEVIENTEYVSLSKEEASEVIALLSLAIASHAVPGIVKGTTPEIAIYGGKKGYLIRRIVLGVDIIREQ